LTLKQGGAAMYNFTSLKALKRYEAKNHITIKRYTIKHDAKKQRRFED
jgi:hypothetical protein